MKMFYSGGSSIAETCMKRPAIMLSYFVVVNKRGKPDSRLRRLMKVRQEKGGGNRRVKRDAQP